MSYLHQFILILSFLLFFIMSISFVRPFRLHRKRKVSTISVKISYLLYQFMFLVFLYFLILTEQTSQKDLYKNQSNAFLNPYFILFMVAAIVPHVTIMIRRQIKEKRTEYNTAITLTNMLFFFYLLVLTVVKEYTRF